MGPPRRERWSTALAAAVIAAVAFALAFTRVTDPDLGFHLATGRAVLALGRIPADNVLSFTEPNHPWILHEWLPAVLFELAFRALGTIGPTAIKIAIAIVTWSIVFATARRLGASPLASGVATLLGLGAAASRLVERPQIFSNLALAIAAFLLASAAKAATDRRRARLVAGAGLVAALTAHVHAGAITTVLLLLSVSLGLALEPLRARRLGDEVRGPAGLSSAARTLAVAAAALALAAATLALYHPHGARPLLVPFQLGGDPYLRDHVIEYRSPFRFPFALLHLYWVFLAIVAITAALRARAMPAAHLVPLLAFAALSLRYVRTADAFAAIAAPILAVNLDAILARAQKAKLGLAAALAAIAVLLPLDHWSRFPPGVGFNEQAWPAALLRLVEAERLAGPAFVSDGWAGPFLAAFYPRERAFFDPRFEAYSPAFSRDVYQRIRYGEPGWEALLDRHGVELVLLKYTSPGEARFQGGRDNLRQHLARSAAWSLVAFGDTGEIFVRRAGPNEGAAARLAIPGIDPDRGMFLGPPAAALPGLLRAIDRGVADNRVLALGALAAAAAGERALADALLTRGEAQRPGDPQIAEARAALGAR